jgi:hypothetical protein
VNLTLSLWLFWVTVAAVITGAAIWVYRQDRLEARTVRRVDLDDPAAHHAVDWDRYEAEMRADW